MKRKKNLRHKKKTPANGGLSIFKKPGIRFVRTCHF